MGHDLDEVLAEAIPSSRDGDLVRVRFPPTGRAQFLAAVAYIRRENPSAARGFRQRTEEALRRLEWFPESGRVVPSSPNCPS